jgi:hypothetical protein
VTSTCHDVPLLKLTALRAREIEIDYQFSICFCDRVAVASQLPQHPLTRLISINFSLLVQIQLLCILGRGEPMHLY